MMMRDALSCRWAAGAKMFVVLLLTAALPAWALGDGKPEPKPDAKPQNKVIDLNDLKGLLGELEIQLAPLAADPKNTKDVDARIAELTKQLEALKAARAAAADKLKKAEGAKPEPAVKERIILIGPDGKVIETKDTKAAPRIEFKIIDGKPLELKIADPKAPPVTEKKAEPAQPIKVQIKDVDGKPQVIVIDADGKEIKKPLNIVLPQPIKPPPAPPAVNPPAVAQPKPVPQPPQPADSKIEEARKALEKQLEALRDQQYKLSATRAVATPAASSAVKVINLTRATYALPKDKAEALGAFLKAYIKASVLELKIEGDGLTVTTTPEVQATVGGLVNLMQDKRPDLSGIWRELKPIPAK